MAMQRLDDSELGRRTRARNIRANAAHRARLRETKRQMNVWIPAALRAQLDTLAIDQGQPLAGIVERVLSAGLAALAEPARPAPSVESSPPADTSAFNQDLGAFKAKVVELWNAGERGYGPIAAALVAGGYRNSNGNAYTREAVKRTLIKAGLVTETEQEAQQ